MSTTERPDFDKLVEYYPSPKVIMLPVLKQMIGGGLMTPWAQSEINDSCTLRMSRALNYGSKFHIPTHFHGLRTLKGADGFNYAYAVQEFHTWMKSKFGHPDIIQKGKPVKRDAFLNNKGIMVFDIVFGLNDDHTTRALGHADLWDGHTFYDEISGQSNARRDFFNIADAVSLWRCPGTAMLPTS
jgi:hypothetical protein